MTLARTVSDEEQPLLSVELDGVERIVQYHAPSGVGGGTRFCGFNLGLGGAVLPMSVLSPRENELYQHMLAPEIIDTANFVHSPMPGVLVSLAVEPGQHIENGQEICVMEAMKMQARVLSFLFSAQPPNRPVTANLT